MCQATCWALTSSPASRSSSWPVTSAPRRRLRRLSLPRRRRRPLPPPGSLLPPRHRWRRRTCLVLCWLPPTPPPRPLPRPSPLAPPAACLLAGSSAPRRTAAFTTSTITPGLRHGTGQPRPCTRTPGSPAGYWGNLGDSSHYRKTHPGLDLAF